MHSALEAFAGNAALLTLVAAMASGWGMWLLKEVPQKLGALLLDSFVVTLSISSDDDVFHWFDEWLSRQDYNRRARRLRLTMSRVSTEDWLLSPGWGVHLFWYRGRPLLIDRSMKEPTITTLQSVRGSSTITVKTIGRRQDLVRRLVDEVCEARFKREKLDIHIWNHGWWERLSARAKRPLHTVYLPAETQSRLVSDARQFFESAGWYTAVGVPYRRGWMFTGGPGTGKTSTVAAIASTFDRPIYYLNLSTVSDDNALLNAFTTADRKCILLLEDVDAVKVAQSRELPAAKVKPEDDSKEAESPRGVTLSGLLNAIDGVASADGRLLIMTTNHPEHLDAALVRPGRVDQTFRFEPLAPALAVRLAQAFFPDARALWDAVAEKDPRSAAVWQCCFMTHRGDPAGVLEELSRTA